MPTPRPLDSNAVRRAQRAIAKHRRTGDSDLGVLARVINALRSGCDPTGTNGTWDAVDYIVGRLDKRETRLKPTLRSDYRPKHHGTAKRAAKKAAARRR